MNKNDHKKQIKNIAHRRKGERQDQEFINAFGMPTDQEKDPLMSVTEQSKRDVGLDDSPAKPRPVSWVDVAIAKLHRYWGHDPTVY